jgi:AcrR family transcriptional regulator
MTDRKQKRIKRVRSEILDAAIGVLSQNGINNVTTKQIAMAADMAEGTLYNYFDNKDDIIINIAQRYVADKKQYSDLADIMSIEDFLMKLHMPKENFKSEHHSERDLLRSLLPAFLSDEKLKKLYYEKIVKPHLAKIEKQLLVLQQKGIVKDHDIQALSRLIYSAFIGFAVLDLQGDPMIRKATPTFSKTVGSVYIDVLANGMKTN